jgi:hypothetical protein
MRCTISQIYLIKYSTCFGHVHCPSSGVSQHCIHATGICHACSVGCLLADANRTRMYCVYTVLRYCWWWTVDLSITCRVLYHKIWEIVHLIGFLYKTHTVVCATGILKSLGDSWRLWMCVIVLAQRILVSSHKPVWHQSALGDMVNHILLQDSSLQWCEATFHILRSAHPITRVTSCKSVIFGNTAVENLISRICYVSVYDIVSDTKITLHCSTGNVCWIWSTKSMQITQC